MLKVIRISLSVLIVGLAIYMLITKNFEYMTFNMFMLSILLLVTGAAELKKGKNGYGYMSTAAALFCFFVTFQGFFLS